MRQRPGAESRSEAVPRARRQESSFRGPVLRSRSQHAEILGSHIKRSRTFNKRNPDREGSKPKKQRQPPTSHPSLSESRPSTTRVGGLRIENQNPTQRIPSQALSNEPPRKSLILRSTLIAGSSPLHRRETPLTGSG